MIPVQPKWLSLLSGEHRLPNSETIKMEDAVQCVLIYYVVVTCFKFENVMVWRVVHKPTQSELNIPKFKN